MMNGGRGENEDWSMLSRPVFSERAPNIRRHSRTSSKRIHGRIDDIIPSQQKA